MSSRQTVGWQYLGLRSSRSNYLLLGDCLRRSSALLVASTSKRIGREAQSGGCLCVCVLDCSPKYIMWIHVRFSLYELYQGCTSMWDTHPSSDSHDQSAKGLRKWRSANSSFPTWAELFGVNAIFDVFNVEALVLAFWSCLRGLHGMHKHFLSCSSYLHFTWQDIPLESAGQHRLSKG